jgi:3-oxoacyl-[acyl-carrier-protein] synthase II
MNGKNAVIVGYDAISPLGSDLDLQWQQALEGGSGIGPLTRFPPAQGFPVRIAGQMPAIDYHPTLSCRQTPGCLVFAGVQIRHAHRRTGPGEQPRRHQHRRRPACRSDLQSAVGGIDAVLTADRRLQAENRLPHPYANPNSCINMIGGKIAMLTGAQGPITSTISACATGLTSVLVGAMLLAQNRADVAICGAVDCALVEPIVAGFFTMNGTFNPKKGEEDRPPAEASRPFSVDRRGFVISEGAGAIILATREFAAAHGLPYRIELAGWGMTSDAHHFVVPNMATIRQCICDALADAGLSAGDIAAVNAHATSTRIGDKVEFDALRSVFSDSLPPVSANKSQIGHAMGASSAIETIFALRGMEEDVVLPTINYQADPDIDIDCVAEGKRTLRQEHLLKNAFGFGGCNACAIFRRVG